jgi:hypothetical protein
MSTSGPAFPARPTPAALPGLRLRGRTGPLRLAVSGDLWRAAWFLIVYVFAAGWLLFAVSFTAVTVAAAMCVTIAGIPLLTAAAGVLRGCASAERARLRPVLNGPLRGSYRPAAGTGILASARSRWQDAATWRDLAYLTGLWGPLFALDTAVVTVWLTFLLGITMPAWYWAPQNSYAPGRTAHGVQLGYFPNGPHGPGGHGFYITTLPQAIAAAVAFAVAFLLFNYVLVGTARLHAAAARGLLGPHSDPLAPARAVLAAPGPISLLAGQPAGADPAAHHVPDR